MSVNSVRCFQALLVKYGYKRENAEYPLDRPIACFHWWRLKNIQSPGISVNTWPKRVRIFEEITQGTLNEFFTLKEEIERLKGKVKTLSPQFFQSDNIAPTPLPEAIRSLPGNPQQLKAILAKIYQTSLQAQLAVKEYKRRAEQYLKLYKSASNSNEEPKSRSKKEQDVAF